MTVASTVDPGDVWGSPEWKQRALRRMRHSLLVIMRNTARHYLRVHVAEDGRPQSSDITGSPCLCAECVQMRDLLERLLTLDDAVKDG